MRPKYHYHVDIKINNSEKNATLFRGNYAYSGGGTYRDQLEITNNTITIQCKRVSKIDLNGVFNNYQSALYWQITKAIFFYIGAKHVVPEISQIDITTTYRDTIIDKKSIGASDFESHATLNKKFLTNFKTDKLQTILEETEKGQGLLKSVSHLTRSKTKTDKFDRFDSLWKSFNALYRTISKKTTDHECQIETRRLILKHPQASITAAHVVKSITAEKLRSQFRWRQLILNDYEHSGKAEAFKDFVSRYTDPRVMHVLKETLPYRKDSLASAGFLDTVEKHLSKHLQAARPSNQQLVAILCIKYAYFVRNKSAHGERLDRIIGLSNKEVTEIKWLSDLLEHLIIDLINANDLY